MKKILLMRAYNTYNNGSFMMPLNLIYHLSIYLKNEVKFYIDINSEEEFLRYKQELPKEIDIEMFPIRQMNYDMSYKKRVVKKLYEPISHPKKIFSLNPDAVIYFGGDDLSEYYSTIVALIELYKLKKISKKIPIFLASQTIGPFTGIRKRIVSNMLKNFNIYLRDSLCAKHLKEELKVKNFMISSDLAFLNLPYQNERLTLKKYKVSKKKYVTLVPSGMFDAYTPSEKDYINSWTEIIKSIKTNKKLRNKKIILMPHVTSKPTRGDIEIIKKIMKNFSARDNGKIIPIYEDLLPSDSRTILGNGILTITGRMHAAISTFQMGKPAISLSYGIKYQGILGEGLKLPELIIESKDENLWQSGDIVSQIKEKVNYVLNNYNKIVKKIKVNRDSLKIKTMDQIKDIGEKIKNETSN
jgi:colanic acid/amylovoran biosynthesis protein